MNLIEMPLFLLDTVLFPDGRLLLRVFEQRYMDMVSGCLRHSRLFGICLIQQGQEVGGAAIPYAVGTRAHIMNWDMTQAGILDIIVRGGQRFRIVDSRVLENGLVVASIELLSGPPHTSVPEKHDKLVALLQRILADFGEEKCFPPLDWRNADWVACRLAELAPLPRVHKQKLLEMTDPVARLETLTGLFHAASRHPA